MIENIVQFISQPWHWTISGFFFGSMVLLLTWMGRSFGISTSFKDICSLAGAGRKYDFFKVDLKDESWRLALVVGIIAGSFLASHFLKSPEPVAISAATVEHLEKDFGMAYPESDAHGVGMIPTTIFSLSNPFGILLAVIGGFLVGFGARYGGGCTSGHAITGLSHFQLPSLITTIGFFLGGLIMTHLILPLIF